MAKNTPETKKQDETTQQLLDFLNRKPIIAQKKADFKKQTEKLNNTPIAIIAGNARPDTLTSALNRIMIATDPEGWNRLHDYDYDGDDFTDDGDFEAETDFISENRSERGHYDEPKNNAKPNNVDKPSQVSKETNNQGGENDGKQES